MKSWPAKIAMFLALLMFASGATTPVSAADVVIERVHTNNVMHVGQRYWVDISVTTSTEVVITHACVLWSGIGPVCFPVIWVQKNKQIKIAVVARQPRRYNLEVFVKYNKGGKAYESNRVSLDVNVEA